MGVRFFVSKWVNRSIAGAGRACGARSLPLRFNRRWVRLPLTQWSAYGRLRVDYEPLAARALADLLRDGDGFVDVGAHMGIWSVFAAHLVGPSGWVLACEPSPAFDYLQQAAALYPAIRPLRIGLGAGDATLTFTAKGTSQIGSFVHEVVELNDGLSVNPMTEFTVPVRSLDSLLAEHGRSPKVVKIDVEGYENEVLKGADKTLAARACSFIVEIHPTQLRLSGGGEQEILERFRGQGYRVDVPEHGPDEIHWVLATPAGVESARPAT
jgi:FkbM family methyltransferase